MRTHNPAISRQPELTHGSARLRELPFLAASAILFTISAALTTLWCTSMSGMEEMSMPGGWTLSMAWMPMAGQTWLGVAASFLGMWSLMMVAMMQPSLVSMLLRYRRAVAATAGQRLGWLTTLAGTGYFFIWTLFGIAVFALGAGLAAITMELPSLARAVPLAVGVIVVASGAFQLTTWKARHLACCRDSAASCGASLHADAGTAWRHGLRLGKQCMYCCANLMAIPLVIGVMDLRAMVVATIAITLERLAPTGERMTRAVGVIAIGAGLFLIARAAGLIARGTLSIAH